MSDCLAPTAPASGSGSAFFRSAAAAGFFGGAFDADDGEDQDGAHIFARNGFALTAIDG